MSATERNSRWGGQSAAATAAGLATAITAPMTSEQIEAYALHVRIEEISQTLRADDIATAPARRGPRGRAASASPEPQYDASGRRVNTRYRRRRERLEDERRALVRVAMRTFPNYRPPAGCTDVGRPVVIREKVYVPVRDFPEINFVGQLLGPRGRGLADMNTRSGANIVIRGRGSVKEGRGRGGRARIGTTNANDHRYHEQDEPLHCLVTADTREKVESAKALIQSVIETAATAPDGANERKLQQLRDLAVANGTFRDDERFGDGSGLAGSIRHPVVLCHVCRNGGHIARDCPDKKASAPWRNPPWRRAGPEREAADDIDRLYSQFLSEMEGGGRTETN